MRWLVAVPLLAALAGAAHAELLLDGIAAQVGSEVVLVSDVREAAGPTAARARASGAGAEDIRQLYVEVLEQMIERALIQQLVKRAEIGASDAEVDEAIASIARENGLSPDKLRASVEAQGMPYALYRDRIRSEIEHARVINDLVASKTRVEEHELKELYEEQIAHQPQGGEQFSLRVIVVTAKGDAPDAREVACGQVDAARARVLSGEAFEAVAREVSESNPESGGEQGWVHESELAGWMREPVEALPAGAVSDRIEAGFGCGVVQVVERRAFVPLTFEQAREALHRRVFDERMAVEYKKLVARLREQTYIERKGIFGEGGAHKHPQPSSAASEPGVPGEPGF
jgi:peptidyl-prolyl cis-trans isomerase SurA